MQSQTKEKRKSKKLLIFAFCFFLVFLAGIIFKFFGPNISEIDEKVSSAYSDIRYSLGLMDDSGQNDIAVHFLYVGQGDCEIIICEGHTMLIDAGESGNEQKVTDYLHNCGITTLDYVVPTHPHSDHIGALPYVIDSFKVKNILMASLPDELVPTYYCYSKLLNSVSDSDINVITARSGIKFSLGGAMVTVIAPYEYGSDLNNNSIVIRVDYKGGSFLFQGDAELEEEESILSSGIDIDCDVIKIGHHGGSSSSNEKYLKAVSPEIAVISCGKNNEYGHPHDKTTKRIRVYTDNIYRTDLLSDIVISYNGKEYKVYFDQK